MSTARCCFLICWAPPGQVFWLRASDRPSSARFSVRLSDRYTRECLGAWAPRSTARRLAIDVQRSEARRSADPLESVAPADPALTTQPQSAEALHGVWEVRRALDELPPDEQEVIRLQHFEGLTHTEIAERLQLPAG